MAYIKTGFDRNQVTLESLDDKIEPNNPVRFIDIFVDSLDLVVLGFKHTNPSNEGQQPFDPADMLKIYIYAYNNAIRSSRRIMRECARNVELMWLVDMLVPDFRSIARFRADNATAIKAVFVEMVKFCDNLGLISHKTFAIDGTKIRAVNSKDKNFTESKLTKRLEMLLANLTKYNAELNELDLDETPESEMTKEQLQSKIGELEERKSKYEGYLKQIQDGEVTQISETDPESRRMKMSNGGFNVAYNVQTVVEADNHIVTEFEVTSDTNDKKQLENMTNTAKESVGADHIEALVDDGYTNEEEIKKVIENGDIPQVPAPKSGSFRLKFDNETEIGQSINNGELPEHLNGNGFEIEDGILIFTPDKSAYKRRKCIAEHPFGTVKYWNNGSYTLVKGKAKAAADLALQFLCYNMKRLLNIVGFEKAIQV